MAPPPLSTAQIESLERATVDAVAPSAVVEIDGWLAPLGDGTIRRAKSAAPLDHARGPGALDAVEAAYAAAGLPPAFRIADEPGLESVRVALAARGYSAVQPTLVMIGDVAALAAFREPPAEILSEPDEAWRAAYLGEGFDPIDGAHRAAALARAPGAAFGAVRDQGRIVAVGVASFGHGWAGVHGLRTALDQRGRGHAGRVLAALGRVIQARGVIRVFLQVEAANPARNLYRRAGFAEAWTYRYWSR